MSQLEMNWSKIEQVKLRFEDPDDDAKFELPNITTIIGGRNTVQNRLDFRFTGQEPKTKTVVIETRVPRTLRDDGNPVFSIISRYHVPQQIVVDALIDSVNTKKEIVRNENIINALQEAKLTFIRQAWICDATTFRPDINYQYAQGNGSLTSNSRTFGTFKKLEFTISTGRSSYPPVFIKLSYSQAAQLPEIVNIEYVLRDNNLLISLKNVRLTGSSTTDGFKTFTGEVAMSDISFARILTDKDMTYPDEVQELLEVPRLTVGDKSISRRMSSILNSASNADRKAEVRTDSIRNKFQKIVNS
jgi:hypothetical protein